jgi:hypothetical protein
MSEHLEPRVAKLETEVRQVRADISDLGGIVEKSTDRMLADLAKLDGNHRAAMQAIQSNHQASIQAIEAKIAEDRQAASERGKISWPLVLSLCVGGTTIAGAIGTVVGLYISLTVSPVRAAVETHSREMAGVKQAISDVQQFAGESRSEMRAYQAKNDVTVAWANDVAELRIAELDRLMQALWAKVYQDQVPPADLDRHGPSLRNASP